MRASASEIEETRNESCASLCQVANINAGDITTTNDVLEGLGIDRSAVSRPLVWTPTLNLDAADEWTMSQITHQTGWSAPHRWGVGRRRRWRRRRFHRRKTVG